MTRVRTAAAAVPVLLLGLISGCTAGPASAPPSATPLTLPPAGAVPDYQLGGAYDPAPGVGIVARDRTDPPAAGVYSICYLNGFQTQPGEADDWPEEVLLHRGGERVIDPDWPDEVLLDTSTAAAREQIVTMLAPWIAGCAADGYAAVEFDNLDSYTRSGGALSRDDNLALATLLVQTAHAQGLASAQKNAAEDAALLREQAGFDFVVAEECAAYGECAAYTEVYGNQVIDIEYTDNLPRPFAEMCDDPSSPASLVLRDRDLTMRGDDAYVFETCGG